MGPSAAARVEEPARIYQLPTDWPEAANLGLGAGVDVVGESFYQESFEAILAPGERRTTVAVLLPEPTNQYDRNAVAVYVAGHKVGHLSRQDAMTYRPVIDRAVDAYGVAVVWAGVSLGGFPRVQVPRLPEPGLRHVRHSRPRVGTALS